MESQRESASCANSTQQMCARAAMTVSSCMVSMNAVHTVLRASVYLGERMATLRISYDHHYPVCECVFVCVREREREGGGVSCLIFLFGIAYNYQEYFNLFFSLPLFDPRSGMKFVDCLALDICSAEEYPCKFFHTGNYCFSGSSCRFSHEPLTEETQGLLDKV